MKLIKILKCEKIKSGRSKYGEYFASFGLFYCPYCKRQVKKRLGIGRESLSCGCFRYKKHGEYKTRLYKLWGSMKERCLRSNWQYFKYYGGRGITVYKEWLKYIPFRDWALVNGYQDNLEIDRINNDGNYEPDNCRFITSAENARNRTNTKLNWNLVDEIRNRYNSGNYTQKQIAEEYNISVPHVCDIINYKRWGKK